MSKEHQDLFFNLKRVNIPCTKINAGQKEVDIITSELVHLNTNMVLSHWHRRPSEKDL